MTFSCFPNILASHCTISLTSRDIGCYHHRIYLSRTYLHSAKRLSSGQDRNNPQRHQFSCIIELLFRHFHNIIKPSTQHFKLPTLPTQPCPHPPSSTSALSPASLANLSHLSSKTNTPLQPSSMSETAITSAATLQAAPMYPPTPMTLECPNWSERWRTRRLWCFIVH